MDEQREIRAKEVLIGDSVGLLHSYFNHFAYLWVDFSKLEECLSESLC